MSERYNAGKVRKIPVDTPSQDGHEWVIIERSDGKTDGIQWCRFCMLMRRDNPKNKPCKGKHKLRPFETNVAGENNG